MKKEKNKRPPSSGAPIKRWAKGFATAILEESPAWVSQNILTPTHVGLVT